MYLVIGFFLNSNYSSLNETTNAKRLNSKSSSSPNGTARIQVDLNLDLTSPIIPTSSSSYSTYSSASSTNSTSSSATTNASSASTLNKTRQLAHKYIQQTSKIVRSASSSSMSLISKLNRSSRSRNSSTCSTNLNNTIDVSDSKKISAKLDKSISSDSKYRIQTNKYCFGHSQLVFVVDRRWSLIDLDRLIDLDLDRWIDLDLDRWIYQSKLFQKFVISRKY